MSVNHARTKELLKDLSLGSTRVQAPRILQQCSSELDNSFDEPDEYVRRVPVMYDKMTQTIAETGVGIGFIDVLSTRMGKLESEQNDIIDILCSWDERLRIIEKCLSVDYQYPDFTSSRSHSTHTKRDAIPFESHEECIIENTDCARGTDLIKDVKRYPETEASLSSIKLITPCISTCDEEGTLVGLHIQCTAHLQEYCVKSPVTYQDENPIEKTEKSSEDRNTCDHFSDDHKYVSHYLDLENPTNVVKGTEENGCRDTPETNYQMPREGDSYSHSSPKRGDEPFNNSIGELDRNKLSLVLSETESHQGSPGLSLSDRNGYLVSNISPQQTHISPTSLNVDDSINVDIFKETQQKYYPFLLSNQSTTGRSSRTEKQQGLQPGTFYTKAIDAHATWGVKLTAANDVSGADLWDEWDEI